MLEAAARSDMFETIIVASRSGNKAQERANNAIIGAGIEGYYPRIVAEELDFNARVLPSKLGKLHQTISLPRRASCPGGKQKPAPPSFHLQVTLLSTCR